MKSFKLNSLQRLVSFILIAVLLLCTVGFAAGGWQSPSTNEPDSGDIGDKTDETDENKDGTTPPDNNVTTPPSNEDNIPQLKPDDTPTHTPPIEDITKHYNKITGLEIKEEEVNSTPLGFVLNPLMPLYGISNSDITFEFPIEDGSTRLLSYTTNKTLLWKVGSLAPTRAFISLTSNFFGGVVISYGNDDVVKYSAWDSSKIELDVSKISECYYIENTLYIYTSKDLVDIAMAKTPSVEKTPYKSSPYLFNETDDIIKGTVEANTVALPFSDISKTELYYSETSGEYLYFKSGSRKIDMLSGKNISFTNVFVLFANATTYEKADGTELVIDTLSGGTGYYISKGFATEIRWNIDENGNLQFKTLSGEKLTVNRGNAYIGYYKASNSSKITFS